MSTEADEAGDLTVVDAAAQLTFAVHAILTRVAADHDLSVTQLRVLGILRDREPSMAVLATQLGLDRSSVTGLIDRAAKRGLVERARSESDARVVTVRLTADGLELSARMTETAGRRISDLLARTSDSDRQALIRITSTVPRAAGLDSTDTTRTAGS